MDSITQAALGAAVGGAIGGRQLGWRAFAWGAGLGTLPDLDVFIHYQDAVDQVTKHRGFSHSIFVLSALSPLIGAIVSKLHSWRYWSATLMVWLCLVTHPILDCFTSYGTQLFWPLETPPIAWSTIFIIDPLYTLPLLVGIGISLWAFKTRRADPTSANLWGLGVSQGYLVLSVILMLSVRAQAVPILAQHNVFESPFLAPTPFNIMSWRVIGKNEDQLLIGYFSWLDPKPITFNAYPHNQNLADKHALPKLARLDWFTHGYYQLQDDQGQLKFVDMRLGVEPYLPFRYLLAEHSPAGWQPSQTTTRLPPPKTGKALIPELIELIRGQSLPIADLDQVDKPAN
ncbi:metal-dependent hydrolase [Corallincola platygyrae]|uniref:Metal-dependent hydrolase n=1 Tax=Corallincola platygyrae TaxID=1193278 RepID=A0ABW4XP51_9GAMM